MARGREEEQRQEGFSSTTKVAAFGGVGIVAVANRKKIASMSKTLAKDAVEATNSRAARELSDTFQVLKHGYGNAFRQDGFTRRLTNPSQMNKAFEQGALQGAEAVRGRRGSFNGGMEFRAEKDIKEMLIAQRKEIHKSNEFNLKRELILKDLMQKLPKSRSSNINEILTYENDNKIFKNANEEQIYSLLDRYSRGNAENNNLRIALDYTSEIEKKNEAQLIAKSMREHMDGTRINKDKFNPELKARNEKADKALVEGFKERNKARQGFLSKVLGEEYTPLTVGHLMDNPEARSMAKIRNKKLEKNQKEIFSKDDPIQRMIDAGMDTEDFRGLSADDNVFIHKETGKLMDLRHMTEGIKSGLDTAQQSVQMPFLNINPLDLLHWNTFREIEKAPSVTTLRRGTIDPLLTKADTMKVMAAHNQDASVGVLKKDYTYIAGKVYDSQTYDVISEDVSLVSKRFGMFPRMFAGMSNLHANDLRDRGFLSKAFDVGAQEAPHMFGDIAGAVTKFKNPEWKRNQLRMLTSGDIKHGDTEALEGVYKSLYSQVNEQTKGLSRTTSEIIQDEVTKAYGKDMGIDLLNLGTEEEVMTAVGRLYTSINQREGTNTVVGSIDKRVKKMWESYETNPESFMSKRRVVSDNGGYVPESLQALNFSEANLADALDDARRLVQEHAISMIEMQNVGKVTARTLVRDAVTSGSPKHLGGFISELEGEVLEKEIRNLETLTDMSKYWTGVYEEGGYGKADALNKFRQEATSTNGRLVSNLTDSVVEWNGKFGMGPGDAPPNYFGFTGYGTVKNGKGIGYMLDEMNAASANRGSQLEALFGSVGTVLKQPFAGRKNLDEVTMATAPFYYGMERVDNAWAKIGLGNSQENRGSMQSIFANMFVRKVVLPYVAYENIKAIDGLLGDRPSDTLAESYVNMHKDVAYMKDFFGVNNILSKLKEPLAGMDQIAELPFMKAFNFATFGLFSDDRSGDEVDKYYRTGETEVRKGRYWGVGSSTPWSGGRVDRYEANWYRKMKSDYEFTDTLWGSEGAYYANSWVPTIRNPLAPLTYAISGADYLEDKHKKDRPYAEYGGTVLGEIPLIGSALDGTMGNFINPRTRDPRLEKSHREYLEETNNYYASKASSYDSGGYIQVMPSGGYKMFAGDSSAGFSVGYGGSGNESVHDSSGSGGYGAYTNGTGYGSGGYGSMATRDVISSLNIGLANKGQRPIGEDPLRSISSVASLYDPDVIADLNDVASVSSNHLREFTYDAGEILGMYGFLGKTVFGFEEGGRGATLDYSGRMNSYARGFWDKDLGGADFAGGGFSEIFRRFLPRDPNKSYYNPIANTMPNWLPGIESFTDFQHGDPYCVSPDTLIEVKGGILVPANKINNNSIIKTHKGVWRKVDAIKERFVGNDEKVFKFTVATLSAFPFKVSEEHPLLVVNNNEWRNNKKSKPKSFKKLKWEKAENVEIGDYVAYPRPKNVEENKTIDLLDFMVGYTSLEDKIYFGGGSKGYGEALLWLIKNGNKTFEYGERKSLLLEKSWTGSEFEHAQSTIREQKELKVTNRYIKIDKELCYFFGNWVAEGSANKSTGQITLSHNKNEYSIVERNNIAIQKLTGRKTHVREVSKNGIQEDIGSIPLACLLSGLFNTGAKNKSLPDWFIELDNKSIVQFLKGLIDGDGCWFTANGRMRVSLKTTSVKLAYQVRLLLLKLGIVASIQECKEAESTFNGKRIKSGVAYQVNANGKSAYGLLNLFDVYIGDATTSSKEKYHIDENYVYLRVNKKESMSNLDVPTVFGFEVGVDDSFCVAGVATHNTKVKNGEFRLPGAAYESMNKLHADGTGYGEWAGYGMFDRYKILADVAPFSDQYRQTKRVMSQMNESGYLTDEMKEEYSEIRDQVSAKKKKHRFYGRRFRDADVISQDVTVTKVLDQNTFLTKEYGNNPLKFAGVYVKADDEESKALIEQYIKPGEKLRVELDADPLKRIRDDTMQTMRAVVYTNKNEEFMPSLFTNSGQNLNQILANRKNGHIFGMGGESAVTIRDDESAVATRAIYGDQMVTVGKLWEWMTHDFLPNVPIAGVIADKFLQVRSPVEHYERDLYSKSWRPWEEPLSGWLRPMVETFGSRNPLLAAAQSAGIGALATRGPARHLGILVGGIVGGTAATMRVFDETARGLSGDSEVWLPNRRKEERLINEWFDKIKYVKYKGLYEKAAEEAQKKEGVDVEGLLDGTSFKGKRNKQLKKQIAVVKKQLSIDEKSGYGDVEETKERLSLLNQELNKINADKGLMNVGPATMLALQYRSEYESTLYGADANGDIAKISAALPAKDRPYFMELLKAAPEDREKILKLVPKDQRRFYQAKWGMKADEKEGLTSFFSKYNLPDMNWEGWGANSSLEDIKVKVVEQSGLEQTEFNLWDDHEKRAENRNAKAVDIKDNGIGAVSITKLQNLLKGAGLKDVDVSITRGQPTDNGQNIINMSFDVMKDVSKDVVREINNNMGSIFG